MRCRPPRSTLFPYTTRFRACGPPAQQPPRPAEDRSERDRSRQPDATSTGEGRGVRPPLVPASPRLSRGSRGAAWLIGAALLAHLGAGWVPHPVDPAAASTSAVSLVDDRGGAALFTSTGLRPGHTETACVALAVTGSAQAFSEVTLSADVAQDDLAPYLSLFVERGALDDPSRCASFTGVPAWSGTLDQLPRTAAAGGPTGWRPGSPGSTGYRVTATVLGDPPIG